MLAIFWIADYFLVRNSPEDAGLKDFDTADASSGDDGPQLGALEVFKKMLTNPIIITIALVEFCSGFIRQAPMQWYRTFAKQTNEVLQLKGDFIYDAGAFVVRCRIMGGRCWHDFGSCLSVSPWTRGSHLVLGRDLRFGCSVLHLSNSAIEFAGVKLSVPA